MFQIYNSTSYIENSLERWEGEARRSVKSTSQHSGKRRRWLGSKILATEVVKIDLILGLIPNLDAVRFLDILDVDMKRERKKRKRKQKKGGKIGGRENSRLTLMFVVYATRNMKLPSTVMGKASGKGKASVRR